MNALQQSANTITYEVEDSNTLQIIIASSDPKKFMITSADNPPVQTCPDSTEIITITSPNLNYNRSTRRIDKAVRKIHKLNDNTAKFNNPHAKIFNNCDTNTAIEYLESYCKVHGIPRSIRCDQAQALKAKEFDIFCKNKNIKLILAPAGDHRGTGMVERIIQTISD